MRRKKGGGGAGEMSRAGGRAKREGLAFIDGNQTGLDGDEADVRSLQRRRKRRFSEYSGREEDGVLRDQKKRDEIKSDCLFAFFFFSL